MKFRGHASAVKPKFPRLPLVRFLSGDTTRGLRGRKTESDRGAEQVLLTAASGRLPALAVQILAIPVMGGIASVILLVIPHWMVSATEL